MKKLMTAVAMVLSLLAVRTALDARGANGSGDETAANRKVDARQRQVLSQLLHAERARHPGLHPLETAEVAAANP